jgi:hypothetical protein
VLKRIKRDALRLAPCGFARRTQLLPPDSWILASGSWLSSPRFRPKVNVASPSRNFVFFKAMVFGFRFSGFYRSSALEDVQQLQSTFIETGWKCRRRHRLWKTCNMQQFQKRGNYCVKGSLRRRSGQAVPGFRVQRNAGNAGPPWRAGSAKEGRGPVNIDCAA